MFPLNGTLKKSGSVGRWETKQLFWDGLMKVEIKAEEYKCTLS